MRLLKSILAVMAMAVTLSLASCSNSDGDGDGPDDSNNNSIESLIVGTWEFKFSASEKYAYTFYKNGTFESLITESGHQYEENGYYSIDGKVVTLHYDGYNDTFEVKSISRNKIIVNYNGQTLTLNRTGNAPDDGDDDEPSIPDTSIKSLLIGSWAYEEYTPDGTETEVMDFKANGTYIGRSILNGKETEDSRGTWSISGNIVTVHITYCEDAVDDIYAYILILKINSNHMEYIECDEDGESDDDYTYTCYKI